MATLTSRYSFTAQYLRSAATFARRAAEIEIANPTTASEDTQSEHIGLVTAAIMQSAAAVEAESAEIMLHGPGHQLGSNGIDQEAKAFLEPLFRVIDNQQSLERFRIILHLLKNPPMNPGQEPWQSMSLLVKLRNELVHFKSKWSDQMEGEKLFEQLAALKLPTTSFADKNIMFFPNKFLSEAAARWAVRTGVAFLNGFYEHLGVESVLNGHMQHLAGI